MKSLIIINFLIVILWGCKNGTITEPPKKELNTNAIQTEKKYKDPGVVKNGLIAYWPLDNDAFDYSGNLYGGQINGNMFFKKGINGNCIEFDGIKDFINFSKEQSPFPISTYTIIFWINTPGMDTLKIRYASRDILELRYDTKNIYSPSNIWLYNEYNPNASQFEPYGVYEAFRYSIGDIIVGEGIRHNNWTMFMMGLSYDIDSIRPYCITSFNEGGSYSIHNHTDAITDSLIGKIYGGAEFFIGGSISDGMLKYRFKGMIDEVRVYNRILTRNEVYTIYHYYAGY